jgi:hypothetical protein
MDAASVHAIIASLPTQVWAVVYAYESPRLRRGLWYDRWHYEIINDYVRAISALGVEPYIVEVDDFLTSERLRNSEIDLVVNLNSGATPISNLGLVPSIAQWFNRPCFPNSSDVLLTVERKDICKQFFSKWFNVPKDLNIDGLNDCDQMIVKPITMGNSQGVRKLDRATATETKFEPSNSDKGFILEEFIAGYEVTVPVFFDVLKNDYVVLEPIVYIPEVSDPEEWFLSYDDKLKRKISIERRVHRLQPDVVTAILSASRAFRFQSLARFDFRWRTTKPKDDLPSLDNLFFLEINCLPTLRTNVNFLVSLKHYLSANPDPLSLAAQQTTDADINALAFLMLQYYARVKTK